MVYGSSDFGVALFGTLSVAYFVTPVLHYSRLCVLLFGTSVLHYSEPLCYTIQRPCVTLFGAPVLHYSAPCVTLFGAPVLHYSAPLCCPIRRPCVYVISLIECIGIILIIVRQITHIWAQ